MELEEALRANASFAALDDEALARLIDVVHVDAFGDGYEFFAQGDIGDNAYLVLEGEVVATRQAGGKSRELWRMTPGEFFGLLAMTADLPHEVTCRGDGAGRVAVFQRHDLEPLTADAPQVALAVYRAMGKQVAMDFRSVTDEVSRLLTS